ncbi:MAG: L-2-hydroxyglutarate oxidase LhgO [Alphaproteobacteria bacterium]|jgi:L-2-hydroxyglutarate oxidase LhgO
MAERTDCIVIGAGVVGLATARSLARAGREVVILEAEAAPGQHTSSRNTGCVHAGMGYVPGSLKSRLALRGKELLYQFCDDFGVGHQRCGKLVVATDAAQIPALHALKEKAEANGLFDMRILDDGEAREMEPALKFAGAVYSPSSGIVDAHELMHALLGDAESHGASLALKAPVLSGRVDANGIELTIGGAERTTIIARTVINAAGLGAQKVARALDGIRPESVPGQVLTRGCYFVLRGTSPFSHLIYPLPEVGHAAVHVSPDMGGQLRFGPDTETVDHIDYTVDPGRAPFFYDAARLFWPDLPDGALDPGYAGIRPKLNAGRASDNDFVIQEADVHGVTGLINLYGIESPGLTSSLAIGEYVTARADTGTT